MSQTLVNIIYVFWIASEIFLNRRLHSKASDKKDQDKNSLRLIWIVIAITITVAIFVEKLFKFQIYHTLTGVWVGVGAIVLGMLLRYWAVFSLGKFFTVDVTIRDEHALKTDGMYKHLRHPSYAASLAFFYWYGHNSEQLVCVGHYRILELQRVFLYRIKIEEKTLVKHFGAAYETYRKHTSAIIPFIF